MCIHITAFCYRLRVLNKDEGTLYVEGFATYSDAKAEDLVPWTPLKTGKLFGISSLHVSTSYCNLCLSVFGKCF